MKKNLLVSFLANEQAKIYIRQTDNSEQFVQALLERGAKANQIILLSLDAKAIFQKIIEQCVKISLIKQLFLLPRIE